MRSITNVLSKFTALALATGMLVALAPVVSVRAASDTEDYWRFKVTSNQPSCDNGVVVATVKFKGGSQTPVRIALQKQDDINYKDKGHISVGQTKKLKDKAGLAYGETANYAVVAYDATEPAEPVGSFTVSRPTAVECN